MSGRAELLLPIADDELILGWRNSEWTGIAPFLEEDVAFSSISQNEVGHARALYQLVAEELGTTADELAFDRKPEEYRCSQFVELRLVPDWAKIDREEAYHRMHARMWFERLEGESQFQEALEELRPMVDQRGEHLPEFEQLWEEMTEVRRSVAGATW